MHTPPLLLAAACLVCLTSANAESLVPAPDVPLSTTVRESEAMARLVVSRDNMAPNACAVDLYVQNQLVAQLTPKQSIAVDVPSGEVAISVSRGGSGYCVSDIPATVQSAVFTPGETREFKIVVDDTGVFLSPTDTQAP
ncbi:MAG: hypothetical protein AAAB16_18440 [Pseudomonas sp.]|uniref:hypothetical protein n=1 Tax=Pseudomonas sp. TaxID=306 RepID=UPI0030F0ECD1